MIVFAVQALVVVAAVAGSILQFQLLKIMLCRFDNVKRLRKKMHTSLNNQMN